MVKRVFTRLCSYSNLILMGDFNFDAAAAGKNTLSNIMMKYRMKSRLNANDFTRSDNTQVDVVYTKFDNATCGTYESYTSGHKPIFCMLNKNKQKPPIKLINLRVELDRIELPTKSKPKSQSIQSVKSPQKPKSQQKPQPKPLVKSPQKQTRRLSLRPEAEEIGKQLQIVPEMPVIMISPPTPPKLRQKKSTTNFDY